MRPRPGTSAGLGVLVATVACASFAIPGAADASTGSLAGRPVLTHARALTSNPIDTSSRTAVTHAWRTRWLPAAHTVIALSGGSPAQCRPYAASATTQTLARSAINFARGLARLGPVTTVTNSHLGGAQRSALMQAVNNSLSHQPPKSWRCWSTSGATAAGQSNLAYRASTSTTYRPSVAQFVKDYLTDSGAGNGVVGHRRWLLRPEATSMANGYALATVNGWRIATNDLWVWPNSADRTGGPRPRFSGWPSAGYFPSPLEPAGRWSLSASSSDVDFSHATVRVTRAGQLVPVHRLTPVDGYADNTLVWQFDQRPRAIHDRSVATYRVVVSHITGAAPVSYTVRLFDPAA